MQIIKTLAENINYVKPGKSKIGYIGWLGHRNLGDEAMYLAFKGMYSNLKILPYKFTKKIRFYEKITKAKIFRAIFLGGGTLINDRDYLRIFREAQHNYKLSFIAGSGVKNLEIWDRQQNSKQLLEEWCEVLRKCKYVGVRGPLSKKILEEAGYCGGEVIGDPALFFGGEAVLLKRKCKKIGINIGVSDGPIFGNANEILEKIVQFSNIMIEKGWEITFVSVWPSDEEYIEEAMRRIGGKVSIFKNYHSIDSVLKCLRGFDLFIGEKLHSVILAMCANTPSIMLEYRPKCLDFMQSMEMSEFNIRTNQINLDKMIHLTGELYDNLEHYKKEISQRINHFKQLQKEKSKLIMNELINIVM